MMGASVWTTVGTAVFSPVGSDRFTLFFFFNDTDTTKIYTNLNTLSLHAALPIFFVSFRVVPCPGTVPGYEFRLRKADPNRSEEHTSELQSHSESSYAVFCLK